MQTNYTSVKETQSTLNVKKIGKKSELLLCSSHGTLLKNTIDATKELLQLINEFGKVARHKINIQKSVAFLCPNNEISTCNSN